MEGLKEKKAIVMQVLDTLNESVQQFNKIEEASPLWWIVSDSVIQRFEYTIDTFWKYLKLYLEKSGIIQEVTGSPRNVLRAAREAGYITISEYNTLLDAVQDRNITSHTYNHELALVVVQHIPEYYAVIKAITERLKI